MLGGVKTDTVGGRAVLTSGVSRYFHFCCRSRILSASRGKHLNTAVTREEEGVGVGGEN